MLEEVIYLIRFNLSPKELNAVFNETEIAERFEEVIKENAEFISNQISVTRNFLISLLKKDKELKSRVLNENNVTVEVIKESAKIFILNRAVSEVLYNFRFDVKQNILGILNSDDEMKRILRKRVNSKFSAITNWKYEEKLDKLL